MYSLPPDTLSGGRGFTAAGAEYMACYPANEPGMNNWIYLYKTLMDAMKEDQPIGGIRVDLTYPQTMVSEETGNPIFNHKRYD